MSVYLIIILSVLGIIIIPHLLFVLVFLITALFIDKKKKYNKQNKWLRFLLRMGHKFILGCSHVKVKVVGKEKLPEGRFLLVSNHRSNFDPIITWDALSKTDLAFISKPENFDIPFIGRYIKAMCYMDINREDPRKAMRTIAEAIELIKSNTCSVAVYPEGTRSKEARLLPFHDAVFKIAQKAQVPIVVMVVKDTEKLHKWNLFKWKTATVEILEVIDKEDVLESKTTELGARIKIIMKTALNEEE